MYSLTFDGKMLTVTATLLKPEDCAELMRVLGVCEHLFPPKEPSISELLREADAARRV